MPQSSWTTVMRPVCLDVTDAARRNTLALPNESNSITSTLGKTFGGATGGFTSGRKELIELLRQRSRPYLFSNSLPPVIAAAASKAVTLVAQGDRLRARLRSTRILPRATHRPRIHLMPGAHPIMPVMLGEATLATQMAEWLLRKGSMSWDSVILLCRKDRPGSACRCRQPTSTSSLCEPAPPSPQSVGSWA